jgi:hypothetical protein
MVLQIHYKHAQNRDITIEQEFDFMGAFVEFTHWEGDTNIRCCECLNVLRILESFISHPDVSESSFELVCGDCAIELEEHGLEIIDEDDTRFDSEEDDDDDDDDDEEVDTYDYIEMMESFLNRIKLHLRSLETKVSECSICLEDGDCIKTPCNHKFHADCLATSFQISHHNKCPMCRQDYDIYF